MSVVHPKVTVYIVSYNYARFLTQAIESVLAQSFADWELILMDDGSNDETFSTAQGYVKKHPDRLRLLQNGRTQGLQACANEAIEQARGAYIMRLDADDFLDENALLVLANFLDTHPETGLVYPNYFYVDRKGHCLGVENRKKIGAEVKLLDLPPHGACTMVRKRILKSIGGYSEAYTAQDGYELWLKVLNRYPVANVSTPLFYYRQHESSVSKNEERILGERHRIKRDYLAKNGGRLRPRCVAVIPAKNTYESLPNIVLRKFAGRPLIDYTIDTARRAGVFDQISVTTDDPEVVDHCRKKFPEILASLRPMELSLPKARIGDVLEEAVCRLEEGFGVYPDILLLLNLHTPLLTPRYVRRAIDTLLVFNADTVISVYEDNSLHFVHGANGLEVLNRGMENGIRLEREALFTDNGAIFAAWRDVVANGQWYGNRVGHVLMPSALSQSISDPTTAWLIEQMLKHRLESELAN